MIQEGPPLETLLRRLAETPADFLAEPRTGTSGTIQVAAVVSDLLRDLGGTPLTQDQAGQFLPKNNNRSQLNRLRIVLIACWLLADDWFRSPNRLQKPQELSKLALLFLTSSVDELASMTQAAKIIADPDRREELARLCLKDLGFRPAGETINQAQDRLNTLSSVERQRVIRAARLAEERARAVREEMMRKAREDAQPKGMRD